MDHLECIRLLDGELFVNKHISVKPNSFSNQRIKYDFEVDSRSQRLAVAEWNRFHYDDGGVNGPQNQLENVRETNDRYVSPPRQLRRNRSPSTSRQSRSVNRTNSSSGSVPPIDRSRLNFNRSPSQGSLLNWYVNTTGVANESSSSSSPSPIKNSSSKRPCTDANNILNASEDGEISTDSSPNVLQAESTRSSSQINAPRSSGTHVDANKQHSVEANNNPKTPTENTLNQATNNNNNQIVLASSALAIPSIVPIGEHVVEWVSLRRDGTRIVAQRTFGCQTSPSLETLKLN
jgi:hypothetical protein